MKNFAAIIDRILAVIGALLFSQGPEFMQQYTQRLSGHAAELKKQVELMSQAASDSGKNLQEFVEKFLESQDSDFVKQGELMENMIHRAEELANGVISLQDATAFSRPFKFIWHLHSDIFSATMSSFKLGVPLTFEGVIYALVGIGAGYLTFLGLTKIYKHLKS